MAAISVLLVDDDVLMLDDMLAMVDWESCGFTVVGTAANGRQALALYQKLLPQVVVTDINMPLMDGLTLIEELAGLGAKPYILIYTSYNEFEYAKRALQNDVADYLLKNELTPASLENKLRDISKEMQQNNLVSRRTTETGLADLFTGQSIDVAPAKQLHALAELQLQYCIISPRRAFHLNEASDSAKRQARWLCEQLYKFEPASCRFPVQFMHDGMVVLGVQRTSPAANGEQFIQQFIRQLCTYLKDPLLARYALFYEPVPNTLAQISARVSSVNQPLAYHRYFLPGKPLALATLKELAYSQAAGGFPIEEFTKEDVESGETALEAYLDTIFGARDIESIKRFYTSVCVFLGHLDEPVPAEGKLFSSREDFSAWILACYQHYKKRNSPQENPYPGVVRRSLEYMQAHYEQPGLTAEAIAEQVGLSAGRLAVLFKSYTGKTINESLTDIRIEQAVRLLQGSNYKIYEIAEKVGYKTPQYFSHIFFQKTNKRPIEYKKKG